MAGNPKVSNNLTSVNPDFYVRSTVNAAQQNVQHMQGELVLTFREDVASATVTYWGFAAAGASQAAASWKIMRQTITGAVTDIKFADGDIEYNNIWNNRAALAYS